MSKTLPGGIVTRYVYGLDGLLLAELDGLNNVLKEYIYLQSTLLAVRDFSGGIERIYYAHTDHLGIPRLLTDAAGQTVWRGDFDPFGKITAIDEDPDGDGITVTLNIRFPGQYYDAETGLHYNWNRYYDPESGRYTTPDPIGIEGGLNLYAYVGGNPLGRVDPDGLEWVYSQSTGRITQIVNGEAQPSPGRGYAGHGVGINNPSAEDEENVGPIPVGTYTIEAQQDNVTIDGRTLWQSMRLTPDEANDMLGRAGFLIHGDNGRGDRSASAGCVVLRRNIRNQIANSGDNILRVIP